MGAVFDRLVAASWKKTRPRGHHGVLTDASVAARLTRVARDEPDVDAAQLLDFIMPTKQLALVLYAPTLVALATRSPRGWLRAKGLELLGSTDEKQLVVAPAWIAHGGGSYKHARADAETLFAALAIPAIKRRDAAAFAVMFAILDLLNAAPDLVWPVVALRFGELTTARRKWFAGRIVRKLPAAIARAKRRDVSALEGLRDAVAKR